MATEKSLGRTFIVGDCHGCGIELRNLIHKVGYRRGIDQMFLVGDLFDRGLHADLVWDCIKLFGLTCIQGNHDRKIAKLLKREKGEYTDYLKWSVTKLLAHGVTPTELLDFIENMPTLVHLREHNVVVTHGGVLIDDPTRPDVSANVYGSFTPDQPMPNLMQGKHLTKEYWWDKYQGETLVVYGHITCEEPRIRYAPNGMRNSIGIDCACVHGGSLVAYCVEEKNWYRQPASQDWFSRMKEVLDPILKKANK